MNSQWRIFMPIQGHKRISVNYVTNKKFPSLSVTTDEDTERLFMKALADRELESAKAYMSKLVKSFDMDEIINLFEELNEYKTLIDANMICDMTTKPRAWMTKSLLVINKERKNNIVHLHFVFEPDKYSKWKIYKIEKE